MLLRRIHVSDYRNFVRLDFALPDGVSLFVGDNAQGKSNLLEAVYLLATMRALRAETDAQLIRREALSDPLPAARVLGEVWAREGSLKLEVTIVARPGAQGPVATKTVKVNGVPRRLADAVGRMTAVLFTADDIDLITGPPSGRRRFLDMMLSQMEPAYSAARSRYERVLEQRNSLLKRIREGEARADELEFWDSELTQNGGLILHRRAGALAELTAGARQAHDLLVPGDGLALDYQPRLDGASDAIAGLYQEEVCGVFAVALRRSLERDIAAGMTLQGPHRDDLAFALDGQPASGYASRAQQRTIALALRLAEARLLTLRRGEPPLLLLDDILSEMDAGRRRSVLAALEGTEQILVTGTDWDRFSDPLLSGAAKFEMQAGAVAPLAGSPAGKADS